jgi:hypothetical protein
MFKILQIIFLLSINVFAANNITMNMIAECSHTTKDYKVFFENIEEKLNLKKSYSLYNAQQTIKLDKSYIEDNKLFFEVSDDITSKNSIKLDDFLQYLNKDYIYLLSQSNETKKLYPIDINNSWKDVQTKCSKQSEEGRLSTILIALFTILSWFFLIIAYKHNDEFMKI